MSEFVFVCWGLLGLNWIGGEAILAAGAAGLGLESRASQPSLSLCAESLFLIIFYSF